jgi:threonine/homoserine/homoserine lactone efflux protein
MVIAATGLGVLIELAPQVLQAVRLAGAAVLIALAVSAWRTGSASTEGQAAPRRSCPRCHHR